MISYSKQVPASLNDHCVILTWEGMQNGDDGQPIELANFADRSVQVEGTFGSGGTARIEGSINGTDYRVLTDPQGNDLDITTGKIEAVTELVRFIRPRIVGGDGTTSLNVTMIFKV